MRARPEPLAANPFRVPGQTYSRRAGGGGAALPGRAVIRRGRRDRRRFREHGRAACEARAAAAAEVLPGPAAPGGAVSAVATAAITWRLGSMSWRTSGQLTRAVERRR